MNALLQLQDDLLDCLNSESYFDTIAVAKLRDLVISQEVAARLPHLAGAGGKLGCGIIVNMPEILAISPNATGQSELIVTLDVVENPELNFDPLTGTLLTCEEVSMQVRAVLDGMALQSSTGWQNLHTDENEHVIQPIPNITKMFPGCAGYRVTLKLDWAEAWQAKVALPIISGTHSAVTITCATGGASIYYTLDGSFPGVTDAEGAAVLYAAPFAAAVGQTVRAKAYMAGSIGSDVPLLTITS